MSFFSHEFLILKETFLLDISLFIVKPSMYLFEIRKWSKDRELKCSEVFVIVRFDIHTSLRKLLFNCCIAWRCWKVWQWSKGKSALVWGLLFFTSLWIAQSPENSEKTLKRNLALPCLSLQWAWEADPLGTYQDGFTVTSWDMGYCNPEQGSMLPSEGPAWVSGVKFAPMLDTANVPIPD